MEQSLDKIDKAILNIIQNDSTISVKDIGDKVGLSTTPTYERIKRLEKEGVIAKYITLVDRNKVGLNLLAFCNIILKDHSRKARQEFEKTVSKIPEIVEVICVTGNYDYMLKIVTADIKDYSDFVINVIADIPNVVQYHSNIVLREIKNVPIFKIP
jgi:Lrp/AsnC family leucine-responsive transcriptional regulator